MKIAEIKTFVVGPLETNCYLVYDKNSKIAFLIDPGAFDKRIREQIEENKLSVKNIINTHGHIDHVAGDRKFGYPVLIHEKDKSFLKNPAKNLSLFTGIISLGPSPERLLKDGDIIKEGDLEFEVIHTPGHTPGSVSLKMSSAGGSASGGGDVIFTGDTLFREGVGRTDIPYGNEEDLMRSVKNRLMKFPDETKILPGHGPTSTIGYERINNPFLQGEL